MKPRYACCERIKIKIELTVGRPRHCEFGNYAVNWIGTGTAVHADITDFAVVRFKNRKCCAYLVTGAYLRELKLGGILKPISQNETGNSKRRGGENRKK